MNRQRWVLTLEALPDSVPPDRRLAKALKNLLRAYRIKVVGLERAPEVPKSGTAEAER